MTKKQFAVITQWQDETFPVASVLSKLHHLNDEIAELMQAIENGESDRAIRFEFADCFLLLFGAANKSGLTYDDIKNCIDEKMILNRSRKWGAPDANGVVKHLKT